MRCNIRVIVMTCGLELAWHAAWARKHDSKKIDVHAHTGVVEAHISYKRMRKAHVLFHGCASGESNPVSYRLY